MRPSPSQTSLFDILVVESDVEIVGRMAQLLASVALCRHAPSGEAALRAMEDKAPDLVMLSVVLPDTEGFRVCARIRQNSTVPVLMMSKKWTDKEEVMGLKIGADGFVSHPYNSQLMVANAIAQLRRAYKYDSQSRPSEAEAEPEPATAPASRAPVGWTTCDVCGYMGPPHKFEKRAPSGKIKRVCPHCGEETHATYSLG